MITVGIIRNDDSYLSHHLRKNDYWSEGEKALQGEWIWEGAKALGLSGEVADEPFDALRLKRHPITGEPLTPRDQANRVAFFDIQLSAPKDVELRIIRGAPLTPPTDGWIGRQQPGAARVSVGFWETGAARRFGLSACVRREARSEVMALASWPRATPADSAARWRDGAESRGKHRLAHKDKCLVFRPICRYHCIAMDADWHMAAHDFAMLVLSRCKPMSGLSCFSSGIASTAGSCSSLQ